MYITFGALIIGLTLGLLGSGGSILTVPVLVYLLGHNDKTAIAESLAIVGSIAALGMLPYAWAKLVDWRSVLLFGVPGMAGTYLGAWLSHYVSGAVQLVLFGLVMLLAAWMMFRRRKTAAEMRDAEKRNAGKTDSAQPEAQTHDAQGAASVPRQPFWQMGLEGAAVGVVTGLVGVGGGFLIVPALVLLGRLPMRMAVGTSLAVIGLNAFSGFFKYLDVLRDLGAAIDWPTVAAFIAIGVIGSVVGGRIGKLIDQQRLRQVFAVFLVGMGLFVLWKEAPGVVAGLRAATTPAATSAAAETGLPLQLQAHDLSSSAGRLSKSPESSHISP